MSFVSDREFKLWDYKVSHKQLLIRSPRTPDIPTNIDVVFWDVRYLVVKTVFSGLVLDRGSREDYAAIESAAELRFDSSIVFRVTSGGAAFFVVAAGFKVLQNELDIFDSSLVDFQKDRAPGDYGKVLCRS